MPLTKNQITELFKPKGSWVEPRAMMAYFKQFGKEELQAILSDEFSSSLNFNDSAEGGKVLGAFAKVLFHYGMLKERAASLKNFMKKLCLY